MKERRLLDYFLF